MYGVRPPQAGTQIATNMLMIVANPIGNVPRNSDWTGCLSIKVQVAGYNVYLRIEIINIIAKRQMFPMKNAMLNGLSVLTYLGYSLDRAWSNTETIPVPIVTENYTKS